MAQLAPKNPLLLFNLYLDDGELNLAGKTVTFKNTPFQARVISWGSIERSIPYPPGQMQVSTATVELNDTDGSVKSWFDAITPLRRLGEIVVEFEQNSQVTGGRQLPVTPGDGIPLTDPLWRPLFVGEVIGSTFSDGKAVIALKDIVTAWLDRLIPKLITRDNFPNMPVGLESAFAPIIFGRNVSQAPPGLDPEGVIECPYINTKLYQYCVARHTCHQVITVYRRKYLESNFKVVSPSEYSVISLVKDIYGQTYTFTVIQFTTKQDDGTVIHADVSGINYRIDLDTGALVGFGEQRNPIDALTNLIYELLKNEVNIGNVQNGGIRYNPQSFRDARNKANSLGLLCDGAITDDLNVGVSNGITVGQAITWLCSDFLLDLYQSNQGEISVKYYDPDPAGAVWRGDWDSAVTYSVNDIVIYVGVLYIAIQSGTNKQPDINPTFWKVYVSDQAVPIDNNLTLLGSVSSSIPGIIRNRIRYFYHRQNAGNSQYTGGSKTGQYAFEHTLDNKRDQDEMLNTLQNSLMEEEVELHFVRDDDVALFLMKRMIGYLTLRSYLTEFNLPLPEVIQYLQLTSPVMFSHINQIGIDNEILKVYSLTFDLSSYVVHCKAVRYIVVPDTYLLSSWTGSHPSQEVQIRQPHLPVLINSVKGDIDVQTNFNDSDPAAPPDEDVTVIITNYTAIYLAAGYSPSDAVTAATAVAASYQTKYRNVQWQQNNSVSPRNVSGYIPITGDSDLDGVAIRYIIGTLDPDTRPTTLTDADIFRVIFHAWDYNHDYWYVGNGELFGTSSKWMVKPGDEPERIEFRDTAPGSKGWKLCDGSTNVKSSDYKGDIYLKTVPNLLNDIFIKGSNAYSGPNPTDAVAPTGSTNFGGLHTHPGSTVNSHAHGLDFSSQLGGIHTHNSSFSHSVSLGGGHSHGGYTEYGGQHDHGGYAYYYLKDHTHTYNQRTSKAGQHSHGVSGSGAAVGSITDCAIIYEGEDVEFPTTVAACNGTIISNIQNFSGNTTLEPGHDHTFEGTTDLVGYPDEEGLLIDSVIFMEPGHSHAIPLEPAHQHTVDHTIAQIFNSEAHTHGIVGNTGLATPGLSISSDGSHSHSITMNTDGKPKSMGLLPYIRL